MAELTYKSPAAGRAQMTTRPGLAAFLNGLPHLNLSDTGRRNVCARFGLNEDELSAAVTALQARPGRPTAALLRTIGAAVAASHRTNATGGAEPC